MTFRIRKRYGRGRNKKQHSIEGPSMNPYKLFRTYRLEQSFPPPRYSILFRLFLPVIGFLALLWFLIRVIPKPSRAAYPCQRIAFPLASGFIVWLMGLVGALAFLKKARRYRQNKKFLLALNCCIISTAILWTALGTCSNSRALADEPVRNVPLGIAKGIHPGRVVWIHDPNATDWDGHGDGYPWEPEHTIPKYVNAMVSRSIRELTGTATDAAAWDAVFRYFNLEHGRGDVGYAPGEKIIIKINLTTCNFNDNNVNENYDKEDGTENWLDKSDTSPQLTLALIRQLVSNAGVEPDSIAIGDTLCHYPNQWRDPIVQEFPDIVFFDPRGTSGRTLSVPSKIRQYWSDPDHPVVNQNDFIPQLYADADYLINLAVLKSHGAGITLCAKNHYGSYNRRPDNSNFYDLHASVGGPYGDPESHTYRAMVDIMGHPHMGGKTLLYMIDGLFGGDTWKGTPRLFQQPLFNNDWPSSLLVSQDPVAIDCVGLDILWDEWPDSGGYVVRVPAVDDYLIEAALAHAPPSGTFYDPDGDGIALQSLGVYERWNNSTDRQYSRNLGTGDGIELRYIRMQHRPGDLHVDDHVEMTDLMLLMEAWLWTGPAGCILEDIIEDGTVNLHDFRVLSQNWNESPQP